jgi:hypothetical protein
MNDAAELSPEQHLERVMLSGDEPGTELVMRRASTDVDRPITGGELALLFRLAKGLAGSGMFKDASQASEAFAKLVFGRDLGLSATQAMTDIHIVEGKPEMSANLQASKVRSSDRYEYRIVELTDERCEIAFTLDGEALVHNSVFTMDDAVTAGLVLKEGDKYKLAPKRSTGWVYYRRNMLFARTMSNGVAFHCPDVMNGIRVYAEGEIVTATAVEDAPEPPEAEVVSGPQVPGAPDGRISAEELAQLAESLNDLGIDDDTLSVFLMAAGVESTEDLTQEGLQEVRRQIGAHMAKGGAQ